MDRLLVPLRGGRLARRPPDPWWAIPVAIIGWWVWVTTMCIRITTG